MDKPQIRPSVRSPQQNRLSGRDYLWISFAMLLTGVLLLVLFVLFAPKMLPAEILSQFFYVVLLAWGLVCALVLFGVLRSYGRLTYRHCGGAIELGGPAACAVLVVVGGFWLAPRNETFALTVRPHGIREPLLTRGSMRLETGSISQTVELQNGEAIFARIPRKYFNRNVKLLPGVDGYEKQYQVVRITSDEIDLLLEENNVLLRGMLSPAPHDQQTTKIIVEGETDFSRPQPDGRFQIRVKRSLGDRVRLRVCEGGFRVFDDYLQLQLAEIEVDTRKPDTSCP
jgi:hypothetical protein